MRKNIYINLEDLQQDVDHWLDEYNHERTHSGKYGYGKAPIQTWQDSKKLVLKKIIKSHTLKIHLRY